MMKATVVFRFWTISDGAFPSAGVAFIPECTSAVGTIVRADPALKTCNNHCLLAIPFFILYMHSDPTRLIALIVKFVFAIGLKSFFNALA